ncbi:MAG: zinc ribbon-containing protein [Gammaproteobacteria bacterium]
MGENKFIQAYNAILEHLHNAGKSVAHGLDSAKEKVSEFGGLTQEEAHKVADYVKRDLEDAAHNLTGTGNDSLSEWLKFDVELIENFALDAFMSVADKTRIELAKLDQYARSAETYHSGEITGPGTLTCEQCNEELTFKSTSVIPPCPKCSATTFIRV